MLLRQVGAAALLIAAVVTQPARAGCRFTADLLVAGRVASAVTAVDVAGCGSRVVATAVRVAEGAPAGATLTDPSWLPGGTAFVYGWTHTQVGVPDGAELRRGDARGRVTTLARLDVPGALREVVVSPDGRRVAMVVGTGYLTGVSGASDPGGTARLFVLDLASGQVRPVSVDPAAVDSNPVWSPDGRRLAFRSDRPAPTLVITDVTLASVPDDISPLGLAAGHPSWSPDGQWIAFEASALASSAPVLPDVWLVHPDGSAAYRVHAAADTPAWAPDGHRLVARGRDGLVLIDTRTGVERRLTVGAADGSPSWSADGRTIAFRHAEHPSSFRDGVWVVRVAGGAPRHLLGWADSGTPVWRR